MYAYDPSAFQPTLALGAAATAAFPGWLPARWGLSRAAVPFAAGFRPDAYGTPLGWWVADDAELAQGGLVAVPNRIVGANVFGSLQQYGGSPLPAYVSNAWNGGPGLVFSDGSSQRLVSNLAGPPADWALALVADQTAGVGNQRPWLATASSVGAPSWGFLAAPSTAGRNDAGGTQNFPDPTPNAGRHVMLLTKVANVITAYRDGVSLGSISGLDPTGLPAVANTSLAFWMPQNWTVSNLALGGTFKAALAFDGLLTSTPAALSAALASLYGV